MELILESTPNFITPHKFTGDEIANPQYKLWQYGPRQDFNNYNGFKRVLCIAVRKTINHEYTVLVEWWLKNEGICLTQSG